MRILELYLKINKISFCFFFRDKLMNEMSFLSMSCAKVTVSPMLTTARNNHYRLHQSCKASRGYNAIMSERGRKAVVFMAIRFTLKWVVCSTQRILKYKYIPRAVELKANIVECKQFVI